MGSRVSIRETPWVAEQWRTKRSYATSPSTPSVIEPYTSFRTADDGSVLARTDEGDAVRIASKWTSPDVVATAVRFAVPGGTVETTDGATLAAPREASIEQFAGVVNEGDRPLVPSDRHAAAVLDYFVDQGHAAVEGGTFYFHPPGGESTGLGYAGALYSVADAIDSAAETIESIETAVDDDVELADAPDAFVETRQRLGDLTEQRRDLRTAADRIRSNGARVERTVLERVTLEELDFDAVEELAEAVGTLSSAVDAGSTAADGRGGPDESSSSNGSGGG